MSKILKFVTVKNSLILLISTFLISGILNFIPFFSFIIFNLFFKEPDQNTNQEEARRYYELSDLILDSARNIISILLPILIILMLLSVFGLIYSVIKKYKSKK
jgi:hypothetical protein